MKTSLAVIKYGGHAMDDPALGEAFAKSLASLVKTGMKFVLVHGGGPQISSLLKRLDIKSHFLDGLRITDAATLEVVEMVLCGQVNKELVRNFTTHGIKAVGISGQDDQILKARQENPALGQVGQVYAVDTQLIKVLLDANYLPIIAPTAVSSDGKCLNINADTAAGAIAGAMQADYFVLVSDVPGVLNAQKSLIAKLNQSEINNLINQQIINGGMIPKVQSCLHALNCGCKKALILDGRAESSLQRYLQNNEPLGTIIE